MLEARNVSVAFGGVQALKDVSVTVAPGEVVGLVGPNGAGKSTLFNCVTGVIQPDAGSIHLDGQDVSRWPAFRRARAGIGRSFQTPRVDPAARVLDAVLTGCGTGARQTALGAFVRSPRVRRQEREFHERAMGLLREFGLGDERTLVGELPAAHLRLLEVARSLAGGARHLLLDEPAAGMDERDRELLARVARRTAAQGCGVLLVEHNFSFVLEVCDRIVVLVGGARLLEGAPEEIRGSEELAHAYLGTAA